jgi:hypothetical protein
MGHWWNDNSEGKLKSLSVNSSTTNRKRTALDANPLALPCLVHAVCRTDNSYFLHDKQLALLSIKQQYKKVHWKVKT